MDTTAAVLEALQKNTAALEWHGGVLFFACGVGLGLLFIALVGVSLLRGR